MAYLRRLFQRLVGLSKLKRLLCEIICAKYCSMFAKLLQKAGFYEFSIAECGQQIGARTL